MVKHTLTPIENSDMFIKEYVITYPYMAINALQDVIAIALASVTGGYISPQEKNKSIEVLVGFLKDIRQSEQLPNNFMPKLNQLITNESKNNEQ